MYLYITTLLTSDQHITIFGETEDECRASTVRYLAAQDGIVLLAMSDVEEVDADMIVWNLHNNTETPSFASSEDQ